MATQKEMVRAAMAALPTAKNAELITWIKEKFGADMPTNTISMKKGELKKEGSMPARPDVFDQAVTTAAKNETATNGEITFTSDDLRKLNAVVRDFGMEKLKVFIDSGF